MTKEFKQSDRIAGLMRRKLAQLIQQKIRDPRLPTLVSLSEVKLSTDLSYAKVYFTVLNADSKETADILNSAASFLRTALARTMKQRTVPQLHFVYDESLEYGLRLSRLIDEANPPEDDVS